MQSCVGSPRGLVPEGCGVCGQARARRQEMENGQLEASLKAAFCAELRSLTRLCEQWEVVERFQQVCNVDIFLF